jgi:glucose-6-phosphate isomerase
MMVSKLVDFKGKFRSRNSMLGKNGMIQTANMESFERALKAAIQRISEEKVVERIWNKDFTIWKEEDKEISNRLGWLTSAEQMLKALPEVEKLVHQARAEGFSHALLLGMGGSSLAPEVFAKVFGTAKGHLKLEILDSTVPASVLSMKNKLALEKTLFVVSSKSGTTVETISLFKYFLNQVCETLGKELAGSHFMAITDPGTPLEKLAHRHCFRQMVAGDPDVGGRFSALSSFGLVPAALCGVEIKTLLERGQETARSCRQAPEGNPGILLGTMLALMAQSGRDKATFVLSPQIESFASWLEQLLAESTGKEGKGILPVLGAEERVLDTELSDRFFIFILLDSDKSRYSLIEALKRRGQPYLKLNLEDFYSLGSQFFLWEMATAIIGFFLKINPFDQPNVAQSKKKAQEFIQSYREKKRLPLEIPRLSQNNISLFSDFPASSLGEAIQTFLGEAREGDYIAVQAFLQPTSETEKHLKELRKALERKAKLPVTTGYGPRYLHSTGQLHKGGRGNGLFIQLTADDLEDAPIPDEAGAAFSSLSFEILKKAQEKGDWEALKEAGRRVVRFHLHQNISAGLKKIASLL